MSSVSRKKRVRAVVFYICAAIALALLWMYKTQIFMMTVSFLNSISEAFDTVGG